MPNSIFLYNKITNAKYPSSGFEVVGDFSIEDNINETASNLKVKIITTSTYREELPINTIVYHDNTATWWVIKSDTSIYLTTGEYEHNLELVEGFEWFNYRHLINCAFKQDRYTLDEFLTRLFHLANITCSISYPTFVDEDKIMPFFAFDNYTVASAIKSVAKTLQAIPKLSWTYQATLGNPTLTFVSRNGIEGVPLTTLNTQFPVAFEKNNNSSEQYATRAISNIQNAQSSELVITPETGGYVLTSRDSVAYTASNAKIFLPSEIDKVEYVNIFPKIRVVRITTNQLEYVIYEGYYLDEALIKEKIVAASDEFFYFSSQELNAIEMPSAKTFGRVSINDVLITPKDGRPFSGYLTLVNETDYNACFGYTTDTTDRQAEMFYWKQGTNELIPPLHLAEGLRNATGDFQYDERYIIASKTSGLEIELITIEILTSTYNMASRIMPNTTLIQVAYYPIGDIKVSYDNNFEAQDEKFYNQTGKIVDCYSATKLVSAHINESVDGTKLRQGKYYTYASIIPLGTTILDTNQLYVITQRSIDYSNGYYSVIYNLSRNRIARSENINAESSIVDYVIPRNNTIKRVQLYKDYLELSTDVASVHNDTPYLSNAKSFHMGTDYVGCKMDFTLLARVYTLPTNSYYIVPPMIYELSKSKIAIVDFQDNFIIGYRLAIVNSAITQTPIRYTDTLGGVTGMYLYFIDSIDLDNSIVWYNTNIAVDPIIPFTDMTNVPENFYVAVVEEFWGEEQTPKDTYYSIALEDVVYDKDPFEIPVFEYQVQINDSYGLTSNVVVADNFFNVFEDGSGGTLSFAFIVSPTIRFTSENADKLRVDYAYINEVAYSEQRITFSRTGDVIAHTLSLYDDVLGDYINNNYALQGKNVGVFAKYYNHDTSALEHKFLYAFNSYSGISNSAITMYINNWRI